MRGIVPGHLWYEIISEKRLRHLYLVKRMSQTQIANLLGVSFTPIQTAMKKYGIKSRSPWETSDVRGSKNPAWKGEQASYKAKHQRVYSLLGSPKHCDFCGKDDPNVRYDWACLGSYDKIEDFVRACKKCHTDLDGRFGHGCKWKNIPRSELCFQLIPSKTAHSQIYSEVIKGLSRGSVKVGSLLPPSKLLARKLGISQYPVLQAYNRLTACGITKQTGAGTMVIRKHRQ